MKAIKFLRDFCLCALVAIGLFWLFFVFGLEQHEKAVSRLTVPPIEQRR